MSLKQTDPMSSWKPSKARYEFRTNPELKGVTTAGCSMGHLQANMAILPSALADDFEQFCELNRAACPILYRSKIGEVSAGDLAPDADIRTDLPRYCVNKNGVITDQPGDLTAYPWGDLVSFYIGCSMSFEEKMIAAGIPLKNITEGRCVSMFPTNICCASAGPFAAPLVVSMRPIPKDLVEKALIITAAYDAVHGAPIHIGDPSVIGIKDLCNSEFGEPSDIGDLIPMFWACGRSSSIAVREAKLPLFFCHYPGSTFICDPTVDDYFKVHKPDHGDEQPRIITLTDKPYLASACSVSAIEKIEELSKTSASLCSDEEMKGVQPSDEFLKIAVRLSHAPSIVMCFLHEEQSFTSETLSSDCIQGAMSLVKALQALNKKIAIVTQHNARIINESITASSTDGISKEGVRVVEWDGSCDMRERLYQGEINHRLDTMIALQSAGETKETSKKGLVDALFKEVNLNNGIVPIKISAAKQEMPSDKASSVDSHTMTTSSLKMAGCGLAAALYVLNSCPIHSRYVRRGTGRRQIFQLGQFLLNKFENGVCSQIVRRTLDN